MAHHQHDGGAFHVSPEMERHEYVIELFASMLLRNKLYINWNGLLVHFVSVTAIIAQKHTNLRLKHLYGDNPDSP
jgi:hypothetical protein